MKFKIGDKVEVVKAGDDLFSAKIKKGYRGVVEVESPGGYIGVRFVDEQKVDGHNLNRGENRDSPTSGWYISPKFLKKIAPRKKKKANRRKVK